MTEINIKKGQYNQQSLSTIKEIYFNSFPAEERRQWSSIIQLLSQNNSPYNIYLIFANSSIVGFLSFWEFDNFCYIEHFAIDQSFRGQGIGSFALKKFLKQQNKPTILEVEPAQYGAIAQRRIDFYQHCGFYAHHDFEYIQPSYGDNLPEVPLMLMSAGVFGNLSLTSIAHTLHQIVYNLKK